MPLPRTQPELRLFLRRLELWRAYLQLNQDEKAALTPALQPDQPFIIVWTPEMLVAFRTLIPVYLDMRHYCHKDLDRHV